MIAFHWEITLLYVRVYIMLYWRLHYFTLEITWGYIGDYTRLYLEITLRYIGAYIILHWRLHYITLEITLHWRLQYVSLEITLLFPSKVILEGKDNQQNVVKGQWRNHGCQMSSRFLHRCLFRSRPWSLSVFWRRYPTTTLLKVRSTNASFLSNSLNVLQGLS